MRRERLPLRPPAGNRVGERHADHEHEGGLNQIPGHAADPGSMVEQVGEDAGEATVRELPCDRRNVQDLRRHEDHRHAAEDVERGESRRGDAWSRSRRRTHRIGWMRRGVRSWRGDANTRRSRASPQPSSRGHRRPMGTDHSTGVSRCAPAGRTDSEEPSSPHVSRPLTPYGRRTMRSDDRSTRTSTKLWKKGATL